MSDPIKDYLVHSYRYYRLARPTISDAAFDDLCRQINNNWDNIDSPYKSFLASKNDLPPIKGLEVFDYPDQIIADASS